MKEYRNSERTKKWIRKAFIELIEEKKEINKITITELVKKADITKPTFYYHYCDIYGVAEEIENELISKLSEALDNVNNKFDNDYSENITTVILFLEEHETEYRLLINATELIYFIEKLKQIFTKKLISEYNIKSFSSNPETRALQVNFLINGFTNLIIDYFKGKINSNLSTIGDFFITAINKLK